MGKGNPIIALEVSCNQSSYKGQQNLSYDHCRNIFQSIGTENMDFFVRLWIGLIIRNILPPKSYPYYFFWSEQ